MRAILTYHSIDDSGSVISVTPADFGRHCAWLAASGIPLFDVTRLITSAGEDGVAVTFDDGFANFAERAWPRLRDYGIPVTLFVVAGRAGATNAWDGRPAVGVPELPLLDWDALGRLAEDGVELAAHSLTHCDLRGLPGAALDEEVAGAADTLRARTGRRPVGYAYPYGAVNAQVVARARTCYTWACTTDLRSLRGREDPHRLPRVDAYYLRAPGRIEAWRSPAFRRWLWFRGRARRLREAVTRRFGPR